MTELKDDELCLNEDGIVFKLEDKDALPSVSYSDLLAKFYKINYRLSPIVMKLESDFQGPFIEKVWWIIMYGSFYLDVMKGSEMEGPHRCRLWFKTFTTKEGHWIATAQLCETFFFNEEQIRKSAKLLIANKEFYLPPINAKIMVNP